MITSHTFRSIALASVAAALVSFGHCFNASAAPMVLLNDNFNAENGGAGAAEFSGFTNFIASNIDLLAPGYFFGLCQSAGGSTACIDMEGSGNGSLTTRTQYALGAGPVSIQFDLAGDQRGRTGNTVTVSLVSTLGAALFSEVFSLPSDAPFTTYTRTINLLAPETAALRFLSGGPADSMGLLLDNVVLATGGTGPGPGPEPVPAPEPGTLLLLGSGLLGLAAAARGRPALNGD